MGDLYKQVGGWKGIRKDILEPLAVYQKSIGMDTSFTRLYDAYKKVDPIWRKLHEEKAPPQTKPAQVGMGDFRVSEAAQNGLFDSSGGPASSMDAGAGRFRLSDDAEVGINLSNYFPNEGSIPSLDADGSAWPETDGGFTQAFQPSEEQSELTKRLRAYFRRPFDRWENDDDSSDIGIYLDKMNTGNSRWPDLNRRQQAITLPMMPAERPKTDQQDSVWDGKNNYPDLFGGANRPLPLINGFMPWPEGKRQPWEIAVKRPGWMEILDIILGRDRKRWPILTIPEDIIKSYGVDSENGRAAKLPLGLGRGPQGDDAYIKYAAGENYVSAQNLDTDNNDATSNPYQGAYAGGGAYGGEEHGVSNDDKVGISAAEFKKLYGGIIESKARELGVNPGILGGMMLTEASGSGFEGGKLKIRLEPGYFNFYTGNKYRELFMQDETGQYYRESTDQPWKPIHESQESERAAFQMVRRLDPDAAHKSISMGLGQIMGDNFKAAGYKSAEDMYEDFGRGHYQQIEGTSRFIRNSGDIHQAMKNSDLRKFARHYNGPGNIDGYSGRLKCNIDTYNNY